MSITELWETPTNEGTRRFVVGRVIGYTSTKCVSIIESQIAGSAGYADAYRVNLEDGTYVLFPALAVAVRIIPKPEDKP